MVSNDWIYPLARSIALFEECAKQPVTSYWGEWYRERIASAKYMRELALSYSE